MSDPADRIYERLLVLRCQAGDGAAFGELVERYGPRLRYFLRKMLRDTGAAEDAARIHAALEWLAPEHREVLVLRFLEDMSYEDVARVTGCALGTVKSRLYHAKRALRRALGEGKQA